jgi:hypothetical protein
MTENEKPKRGLTQTLKNGVAAVRGAFESAKRATFDALASFTSDGKQIDFPIDFETDTVLSTQAQLAELFGVTKNTIGEHLQNLFATGELVEAAVTRKSRVPASDGKLYETKLYDLDAIIAVGYRLNSRKATEFRKWSTTVLKGYIEKGYALNGKRLNSDPAALLALAREVRSIRTSEKNLYEQVRETFKQCSIDYDASSPEARRFFSTSQDMFHYATSGMTAKEIILARADARRPQMGLLGIGNRMPTAKDVTVAKNYCDQTELRLMELIGESWLVYAEGMATRGKQVSMARLLSKLTELIALNEYPVFPGYPKGLPDRDAVDAFAKGQLAAYKQGMPSLPPATN